MEMPKIFESEYRFCLILWEHEPVGSGELVRLCGERLGWKPTTVYTVIKRLSERGVLKNENSVVTALVSKDDVQAAEIDALVEKKFGVRSRHLWRHSRGIGGFRRGRSTRCSR